MTDKYGVIYVDPPWWYNERRTKGRFGLGSWQYDLMPDDEVLAMGEWVQQVAEDDCALLMWATGPRLPMAVLTMTAWGWRYVTVAFAWVKLNARQGNLKSGPGHYTASNLEICLLGVRGSMLPTGRNGSANKQVLLELNDQGKPEMLVPGEGDEPDVALGSTRKHSQKPDIVRTRIVQMWPDARRLELFARSEYDGWSVWGKEVDIVAPMADAAPNPVDDELGYHEDLARALGLKPQLVKMRPASGDKAPAPPWTLGEDTDA